jgi:hypothetical protein
MTLIGMFIFLIILGVVLWLLRGKIDPTVHTILIILVCVFFCLWLLSIFGLVHLPSGLQPAPAK